MKAWLDAAVIAAAISLALPSQCSAQPQTPSAAPRNVEVAVQLFPADQKLEVVVHVETSFPDITCTGKASSDGLSKTFPRLRTGTYDGGEWYWYAGNRTRRATLTVDAQCELPNAQYYSAAASTVAGPGPQKGHGRVTLVKPGSLHTAPWDPGKAGVHVGIVVAHSGIPPSQYPFGQSTWYVALRRPDLPYFPGALGEAKRWIRAATAFGIPTGSRPQVSAVAVFEPGQDGAGLYGHVAYVTAVHGPLITVAEASFHDLPAGSERTLPWSGLHFIYKQEATPPPPPPPPTPPPPAPAGEGGGASQTLYETAGGVTNTWTNYLDAGGRQGPGIAANSTVEVWCRVKGFALQDGDNWWYLIASPPWNGSFYASADAFYNNGQTSGSLVGTPFVDPQVPLCSSATAAVGA